MIAIEPDYEMAVFLQLSTMNVMQSSRVCRTIAIDHTDEIHRDHTARIVEVVVAE